SVVAAPPHGCPPAARDSRAPEAADAGGVAGVGARGNRAAAGPGRVGGSTLGGPLLAGGARPPGGADAHGPAAPRADVSSGVSPAPGQPRTVDPTHPDAPDAAAGRRDGTRTDAWQGPAGGHGTADWGQDRWRAPLCGRADQGGVGGWLAARLHGPLRADGSP